MAATASFPASPMTRQDSGWVDGCRQQPAGLALSAAQWQTLAALQQQLQAWSQRLNLTRLLDGDDYWIAQVIDGLWPLARLGVQAGPHGARPLRGVDVGTGGGLPGLLLAVAVPDSRWLLVDSVARKCAAVRSITAQLGLGQRVEVVCERAEVLGRDPGCRGRFDLAVARAVAAAPVVAEYLVPLLNRNGTAWLYRGRWSAADHAALSRAATLLRCHLRAAERYDLPGNRGERHLLVLEPRDACPAAYPRRTGLPAKAPLAASPGC